ncbi:uncharacterized protein RJT20DRAFT_117027 [Scheffersomyces xylosifermentans]|uniref:uncharacterized protein n=1 Tax=Scheffersomyces xylosifermentans TaxID=1304137 RepID=UPI00315C98D1
MDNSNPNAASSSTTTSNSGISSSSSSFVSPQLSINHIIGTSASSPNHFSVQGNVLAYTASGGVVVRQLNSKDGSVVTERFFCANSSSHNDPSAASQSSADAYLNMALSDLGGDSSPKEVGRDSFGYPISSEPIIIGGNNLGASSSEINGGINDIDLSSPSKLKNRVRSINCICLSPNKKILAVGEKGYQPRILIFSLAPDSNSSPVLVIHEHTFGINTICFSPDSKYLCSLGFVNDGFINVWKLSTASVQMLASNRCSSIINQLIWHEDYILTLGLRLIKVWRFTEAEADSVIDKPCVLKGKNVLLGHMINSNFTNASILNDDELLIITSYNQLLLLKLGSELRLIDLVIPPFDFDTLLVDYEHEKIWFGLPDSSIDHYKISELKERKVTQSVSPVTRMTSVFGSQSKEQKVRVPILKLANFSADYLVYLTDAEEIVLYNKALEQDETTLASSLIKDLAGIKDCNLGELLVYSKDGLVKRVLSDSDKLETVIKFNLPSNELISNSLTALDAIAESVILGDKYGNLYVVEPFSEDTYKTHYQVKAHSSSINDMVYYEIENYQLITSISRDRMIQFFFRLKDGGEWDILQTVPVHNGNLLKIQYQDNRIYVCSSDRTISIHNISVIDDELVVFQEKIISVKSSPINVKIFQDDLVVSTNDRSLTIYDITQSFELKRTLKFTNEKTNESLLVENFIVFKNVIITSSSDKSLRVFNYATGKQLSLAWGHSDVIVSLILDANNNLVSIGKDGCLFSWKLEEPNLDKLIQASSTHDEQDDSIENTPLYSKVTRKILPTSPIKLNIPKGEPDRLDIPSPKSLAPNSKSPTQSPRLTTATLKRIEARRNSLSPTKPLAPENSRSKSVSTIKTAPMVPTLQKAQTTTNLPSPTRSPVASPTKSPFRSPTRSLAGSPVRSIRTSGDISPLKAPRVSLSAASERVSARKKPTPLSFVDKTLWELEQIEYTLQEDELEDKDRERIFSKVEAIFRLLGVDEASCEHSLGDPITLVHHDATKNKDPTEKMDVIELLEKYSDKLIALVETKLDARNKPKHFTHLLFNEAIHNHSTSPSKDTLVDNPFD